MPIRTTSLSDTHRWLASMLSVPKCRLAIAENSRAATRLLKTPGAGKLTASDAGTHSSHALALFAMACPTVSSGGTTIRIPT